MTRIPVFVAVALSLTSVRGARAHESSASRHHTASHDMDEEASHDMDDEDQDCDRADDDDATEALPHVTPSSFAWAVVREDGNSMSGSLEDLRKALRLRKTIAPPYLWVRDGDERYVISDEKVLDRLDELEEPQRVLAAKQAKLGAKQSELGRKQARLGLAQGRAAMEKVRRATSGDDDDHRTELRQISDEQRELGHAQGRLGREQGALGREQGRLGRRLQEQVRELYQQAKKSGAARRVD